MSRDIGTLVISNSQRPYFGIDRAVIRPYDALLGFRVERVLVDSCVERNDAFEDWKRTAVDTKVSPYARNAPGHIEAGEHIVAGFRAVVVDDCACITLPRNSASARQFSALFFVDSRPVPVEGWACTETVVSVDYNDETGEKNPGGFIHFYLRRV